MKRFELSSLHWQYALVQPVPTSLANFGSRLPQVLRLRSGLRPFDFAQDRLCGLRPRRSLAALGISAAGYACSAPQLEKCHRAPYRTRPVVYAVVAGRKEKIGMENKPAQNIQDSFLNNARKDKAAITVYLLSGVKLTGRLR